MGLFDKKYCDFCGDKIGLIGNRKLEDGNMCKDCAKKLSPFCDDRRHSTVEHIKAHLQYREQNAVALKSFTPTLVLGENTKFYIDNNSRTFVVSKYSQGSDKWFEENPDVIPFSQVTGCGLDIDEDQDEIYTRDREGNQVSYNPPKYEYRYDFKLKFTLNNPFFDDFDIKLNGFRVKDRNSLEYNKYYKMANDIMAVFGFGNAGFGAPVDQGIDGIAAGIGAFFNQVANNAQAQQFNNNGYAPANAQPQYNNGYAPANAQPQYNNGYAPANAQPQYNNGYAPANAQPQQPVQQGGLFCPECGAPLNGAGNFCTSCGARLP